MRKEKKPGPSDTKNNRILFFDLVRIFCIIAIVYAHLRFTYFPEFNSLLFADGYLPFGIYTAGLQGWAVFGLIFVSGAVLELNYQRIEGSVNYLKFMFRRSIRIYPAFWLSLLFGLFLNIILTFSLAAEIIKNNLFSIIFEYTGFFVILGRGGGFINQMGWFIAAIVSLYLLFPFLSDFVKKYRLIALGVLMIVSFGSRALFFAYQDMLPDIFWMWFPLCNVFEFSLGIAIIQTGLYPKNTREYPSVHKAAELTFYIFLFQVIIIQAFNYGLNSAVYENLVPGNAFLGYSLVYLTCMVTIILISVAAMVLDRKIQQGLRQNEHVKRFLKS
jgi:peptidoglycan/LPS O-acetylase OafA/YrhL